MSNTNAVAHTLSQKQRKLKNQLFERQVQQLKITPQMKAVDLVEAMQGMSIQARNIGLCAAVLRRMLTDKGRPTILLGLAGPLIAAGLRNVICDMIQLGMVDVVVSTGAILYQDIYQARGFRHYQGNIEADDTILRDLYIDRIYDTYVDEEKFWETDIWCGRMADKLPPGIYSSRQYLDHIGSLLRDDNSIVRQCHKLGVPIFSPALNDSSIGIGLTDHHHRAVKAGRTPLSIDSIQDNYELTQIVVKSKKTAAIYVAGGVPKNYINDSIVMSYVFGVERGHSYALQVTTAVTADGGLSSSTLSEARSWGKIKKDANFAMAWVEPSVAIPLLASYAIGKRLGRKSRLQYDWKGKILKSLKVK